MAAIAARKKRFKFHKIMLLRDTNLSEIDPVHKPGPIFRLSDREEAVVLQSYSHNTYAQFTHALTPLIDKAQNAATI